MGRHSCSPGMTATGAARPAGARRWVSPRGAGATPEHSAIPTISRARVAAGATSCSTATAAASTSRRESQLDLGATAKRGWPTAPPGGRTWPVAAARSSRRRRHRHEADGPAGGGAVHVTDDHRARPGARPDDHDPLRWSGDFEHRPCGAGVMLGRPCTTSSTPPPARPARNLAHGQRRRGQLRRREHRHHIRARPGGRRPRVAVRTGCARPTRERHRTGLHDRRLAAKRTTERRILALPARASTGT